MLKTDPIFIKKQTLKTNQTFGLIYLTYANLAF